MIVLTFGLLAAWLTLRIAPATPIGRALHDLLVAGPARLFNRITRGHVATVVLLLAFGTVLVWQLEGDGVRLLSMMAPEIGTFLTMFEISTYLDAAIAVIAVSSTVRWHGIRRWRGRTTIRRAPRAIRTRRRPPRPPAANDDDGHGAVAQTRRVA